MNPLIAAVLLLLLAGCSQGADESARGSAAEVVADHGQDLSSRASDGDLNARYVLILGEYWEPGRYAEAIPLLEALARDGSSGAAHHLADAYSRGLGVEEDLDTAAHWLGVAADLGSDEAERSLALYEQDQAERDQAPTDG